MVNCWAVNCSNRSEKGFKLFRFPKTPSLRLIWVQKVSRLDPSSNPRVAKLLQPSDHSRLCEVSSLSTYYFTILSGQTELLSQSVNSESLNHRSLGNYKIS